LPEELNRTEKDDIVSAPTTRPPEPSAPADSDAATHTPGKNGTTAAKRVAPQQLTGAQAVVRSLEELGVDTIFGIPGGAVLPVYDPLFDSQKLRHVLVRHEQGAGHAASGYAHATGKVGVMMAT
jgi:acetolactate synthase-1/2/3 large subunit